MPGLAAVVLVLTRVPFVAVAGGGEAGDPALQNRQATVAVPSDAIVVAEAPPIDQTITLAPTEVQPTTEVLPPMVALPPDKAVGMEGPTSTMAPPTETATPTLTHTPKPTNTGASVDRLTKTDTPPALYPAPTLEAPREQDAASVQGVVTFRWSYPHGLAPGEAFQVLIWQEGEGHWGAAQYWTGLEQTIDLDGVPQMEQPGEYLWSVVVVDVATDQRQSPEASPWRLVYTGTGGSGSGREPPEPEH